MARRTTKQLDYIEEGINQDANCSGAIDLLSGKKTTAFPHEVPLMCTLMQYRLHRLWPIKRCSKNWNPKWSFAISYRKSWNKFLTLCCFNKVVSKIWRFFWSWKEMGFGINPLLWYRGILVYNICLISTSNSVSDGAANISVLNIERSQYD